MGRTERAREILDELEQKGETYFPELLVALGEYEAAVLQMEHEYEARTEIWRLSIDLRCPLFAIGVDVTEDPGLRDNPRFQELLRRIDFPDPI